MSDGYPSNKFRYFYTKIHLMKGVVFSRGIWSETTNRFKLLIFFSLVLMTCNSWENVPRHDSCNCNNTLNDFSHISFDDSPDNIIQSSYDLLSPFLEKLEYEYSWTHSTLFMGTVSLLHEIQNDSSQVYLTNYIRNKLLQNSNMIQENLYKIDFHHPDYHAYGQVLYELQALELSENYNLYLQKFDSLFFNTQIESNPWYWIDALFMSAPLLLHNYNYTGDIKYLDFFNKYWKQTYQDLYDTNENLFFRDMGFTKTTPKIFWLRGNGWVIACLAQVLIHYPKKDDNYEFYLNVYKNLCCSLVQRQKADGLWSSDLNYESTYSVESSGSSLICYGLAFGLNNGLLDSLTFYQPAIASWEGLKKCIVNNQLIFCQPPADRPEFFDTNYSSNYGTGVYLFAASEIIKLIKKSNSSKISK